MNKMGIMVIVTATSLIFAAAATSFAQQGPPGGTPDNGRGYDNPSGRGGSISEEKRAEIGKKIQAVRILRLTEELKLDASTSAKLAALLGSIDQQRMEIAREQMMTMKELRRSLKSAKPDEQSLKAAIDKLAKNRHAMQVLRDKELNGLKDILTTEQQARFLVFQQDFQREMRQMIAGAREGNGSGRGRVSNGIASSPDRK